MDQARIEGWKANVGKRVLYQTETQQNFGQTRFTSALMEGRVLAVTPGGNVQMGEASDHQMPSRAWHRPGEIHLVEVLDA